jgi:hypothetical protein
LKKLLELMGESRIQGSVSVLERKIIALLNEKEHFLPRQNWSDTGVPKGTYDGIQKES